MKCQATRGLRVNKSFVHLWRHALFPLKKNCSFKITLTHCVIEGHKYKDISVMALVPFMWSDISPLAKPFSPKWFVWMWLKPKEKGYCQKKNPPKPRYYPTQVHYFRLTVGAHSKFSSCPIFSAKAHVGEQDWLEWYQDARPRSFL